MLRYFSLLLTIAVLSKLVDSEQLNKWFRAGFGAELTDTLACVCPVRYRAGFQYYCGHELYKTNTGCFPEAIFVCSKYNNTNTKVTYGAFKKKCEKKCNPVDCSKSNDKDCEQHQLRECE
jgi:hypothetical protein